MYDFNNIPIMILEINREKYQVNSYEFNKITHNEYNNLEIRENLGLFERLISLILEIKKEMKIKNFHFLNPSHGGFMPISVAKQCDIKVEGTNVFISQSSLKHKENILQNIHHHTIQNISFDIPFDTSAAFSYTENSLFFAEDSELIEYNERIPFILTKSSSSMYDYFNDKYTILDLKSTGYSLFIHKSIYKKFKEKFHYFIDNNYKTLKYDNLIHLCIMVKNGGDQFENMLLQNLPIIDRWTILDTGSTDRTIEIINRVLVGKKKGNLYCEPFINFRESRNRCLELAGQECKFTVMLDDSYIIRGEFVEFLNEVRGDQFSDSFSLYIQSHDVEYVSNRVLKTYRQLKYIYKMHEVIQKDNNINVIIPIIKSKIDDFSDDYMQERTIKRKDYDLQVLFEEIEENPDDPRNYYYVAQTYKSLNNKEKAYEYFLKRGFQKNEGFIQERIDAIFEGARLANFELNVPWEECEILYRTAYELDKTRPDSIYFIGINYYLKGDMQKAFEYFKLTYKIGYPLHCQYSLKPTLSFTFCPKFLAELCYQFGDYKLGEEVSRFFLDRNKPTEDGYDIVNSWYPIYCKLNLFKSDNITIKTYSNSNIDSDVISKPIFCFLADGGFSQWTGRDLNTKGMGGSETYIVEMATWLQRSGRYNVFVFCNCGGKDVFEDVSYLPISQYYDFISDNEIEHCLISRFSEYIPVSYLGNIKNIYFVCHDLAPSNIIIPMNQKLKRIFCMTEWHKEYFDRIFPSLKDITIAFYNGIDFQYFEAKEQLSSDEIIRIPYKFIYSSFPNRGLLPLLQMWPKIVEREPSASLHLYCDVDGAWVNSVASEEMQIIKNILQLNENAGNRFNIYYHGWVDKKTLHESWLSADIWLYPCTFQETFCITALEAARSRTLAIATDLAGLKNTVGDRGLLIEGNAYTSEWQEKSLEELFSIMKNQEKREDLIRRNYEWSLQYSWKQQAERLMELI